MAHLDEQQFRMTRGDTKKYRLTVKDEAGVAMNLTGATIKFQARKHPHSPAVITKTEADGIIVENAAGGVFRIELAPADTNSLGNWLQEYGFDVQVTKAGEPVTVASGMLIIEPDFAQ